MEMLIHTFKHNNVPVARLDCCFGTNRIYGQNERTACRNHFEPGSMTLTLIYVLALE
jgi:hypothetical protein